MVENKILRYCLQRLITYDSRQRLSEWKNTRYCSNSQSALYPLLTEGNRIWDTVEMKVVKVYGI